MTNESAIPTLEIGLAVLAVVVILYSVVIASRPLFGVFVAVGIFAAYLLWGVLTIAARFARAAERIADSMEDEKQ
jgi:hypothetical protein